MSHGHHHHDHHHLEMSSTPLLLATILNFIITVIEIIGGVLSNSLSLISDAFHNLGDTIASLLAYLANRMSKRKASVSNTFGFKRIEILSALLNAATMVVICVFLLVESFNRFLHPEPVKGKLVFIVATAGLIANLIATLLLNKGKNHNINFRAAYIHLLGDTLSSIVVIIGGIMMYFFHIFWIDPLITALISLYILKSAFGVLKQAYVILMQAVPSNLKVNEIKEKLETNFTQVDNIHHIHLWNLNDNDIYFECHADLKDDLKVSETDVLGVSIRVFLNENFHIHHSTIQFEYNCCESKAALH